MLNTCWNRFQALRDDNEQKDEDEENRGHDWLAQKAKNLDKYIEAQILKREEWLKERTGTIYKEANYVTEE